MFDSEAEIEDVVTDKESELSLLYVRMEKHFDIWRLKPYAAEAGYESYTSTAPRNFFDKVIDALNRASLTIQIELPENATEGETKAASIGELFLFGALNDIDRRQALKGEPPLREALGFIEGLRGWLAMRALVARGKDGEPVFDVIPWDPLHMTWEKGKDGLLWACQKRKATKAQIKAEYGIDIGQKDAEVLDFWDTERNSIIIDKQFVKRKGMALQHRHKIGRVPVFIQPVGSMPSILMQDFTPTLEYQGDSVYATSQDVVEADNKYISWTMDRYRYSRAASIYHKSRDGAKELPRDPYLHHTVMEMDTDGEEVGFLDLPPFPSELAPIMGRINADWQQSTLPYPLAYGGTQQAMSGAALSVLSDATRSVYSPRSSVMAQAYEWLSEELLSQYTIKGVKPKELRGHHPKDGKFFSVKVKPTEVDPGWQIKVTVEPRMPRDQQGEIMTALAATQKRGPDDLPLMSKGTAREEILHIRDPQAEESKVLKEEGEALPPIRIAQTAKALKEAGREDLAEMVLQALSPQMVPQGVQGVQGAPGAPAPAGGQPAQGGEPTLRDAIGYLEQSGQGQLAQALLAALGIMPQGQGAMR